MLRKEEKGLQFHPEAGTILLCRYEGFELPEMVKPRPVIVVSPRLRRNDLVTVVALSTTAPQAVLEWHYKLVLNDPIAPNWPETELWVKCDMLNTFRLSRLDRMHKRVGSHRKYYEKRVSAEDLLSIRKAITAFLLL